MTFGRFPFIKQSKASEIVDMRHTNYSIANDDKQKELVSKAGEALIYHCDNYILLVPVWCSRVLVHS